MSRQELAKALERIELLERLIAQKENSSPATPKKRFKNDKVQKAAPKKQSSTSDSNYLEFKSVFLKIMTLDPNFTVASKSVTDKLAPHLSFPLHNNSTTPAMMNRLMEEYPTITKSKTSKGIVYNGFGRHDILIIKKGGTGSRTSTVSSVITVPNPNYKPFSVTPPKAPPTAHQLALKDFSTYKDKEGTPYSNLIVDTPSVSSFRVEFVDDDPKPEFSGDEGNDPSSFVINNESELEFIENEEIENEEIEEDDDEEEGEEVSEPETLTLHLPRCATTRLERPFLNTNINDDGWKKLSFGNRAKGNSIIPSPPRLGFTSTAGPVPTISPITVPKVLVPVVPSIPGVNVNKLGSTITIPKINIPRAS